MILLHVFCMTYLATSRRKTDKFLKVCVCNNGVLILFDHSYFGKGYGHYNLAPSSTGEQLHASVT